MERCGQCGKPEIQVGQHEKFPVSFVSSWSQKKRLGAGHEMVSPRKGLFFFLMATLL